MLEYGFELILDKMVKKMQSSKNPCAVQNSGT